MRAAAASLAPAPAGQAICSLRADWAGTIPQCVAKLARPRAGLVTLVEISTVLSSCSRSLILLSSSSILMESSAAIMSSSAGCAVSAPEWPFRLAGLCISAGGGAAARDATADACAHSFLCVGASLKLPTGALLVWCPPDLWPSSSWESSLIRIILYFFFAIGLGTQWGANIVLN